MTDERAPSLRRDLAVVLAALVVVAAWDLGGLDFPLSRLFAGDGGFRWRDDFVASRVLHDGGRWLAWAVLGALACDAWRPLVHGPSRRLRAAWVAATLLLSAAVPGLKRLSDTSCPWDVAGLGGRFPYVPHWLAGVVDGGPGHCFPSGHAVSAFAFVGLYFLWRRHRPALARALLLAVLAAGVLFGAAQLVRGAHFLSHTLWSAWLCWAGALAFELGLQACARRRAVVAPRAGVPEAPLAQCPGHRAVLISCPGPGKGRGEKSDRQRAGLS